MTATDIAGKHQPGAEIAGIDRQQGSAGGAGYLSDVQCCVLLVDYQLVVFPHMFSGRSVLPLNIRGLCRVSTEAQARRQFMAQATGSGPLGGRPPKTHDSCVKTRKERAQLLCSKLSTDVMTPPAKAGGFLGLAPP